MSQPPQQPQPQQPVGQGPVGEPAPAPGEVRSALLASVQKARTEPDMAGQVYASMGFNTPVSLAGYQDSVARIKPGDLVGWHGANQPDGRYVGNVAIYMGDRQILENFYGTKRVRALTPQDNVFGMPVILTGNAPTVDDQTQLSPPDPGMGTTEPGLAPS